MVDIPDIVTYTNFGDHRLRVFFGGGGKIFPSPIDFDRRPYNTLAPPCERVIVVLRLSAHQSSKLNSRSCTYIMGYRPGYPTTFIHFAHQIQTRLWLPSIWLCTKFLSTYAGHSTKIMLFVYAWVLIEPHRHQAFAYLQMNLLYTYDAKNSLYNIV